ncbi:MAG: hypothetical protein SGJ20_20880 [Planctomycetota bacterium]|nr:hypothetical protein [Planctomycetota bacterium]
MKKKVMNQFLDLYKKSLEVKPKKLDAEWRAIHASINVLLVRYHLYVKARKKKRQEPIGLEIVD